VNTIFEILHDFLSRMITGSSNGNIMNSGNKGWDNVVVVRQQLEEVVH